MPYLYSKIERHNEGCINPVAKRLYIRDYDDKGKQKFVSWGLTCITCGIIVKEKYQPKPTSKQLKWFNIDRQFGFDGKKLSNHEYLDRYSQSKINMRIDRLKRKALGPAPITPRESGLRTRIRNLKKFYDEINRFSLDKNENKLNWDLDLCERFLKTRPNILQLRNIVNSNLLKHRGRIPVPIPDKPGWVRYERDHSAWIALLRSELERRKEFMNSVIGQ